MFAQMCALAKPCRTGCPNTYHVPDIVRAKGVTCATYSSWLERQALNCKHRDPVGCRQGIEVYRAAINAAVVRSAGFDEYTGEPLEWNRLNQAMPEGVGRRRHRIRGRYPSVDHYQGLGVVQYRICSGTVNAAKGALDHQQFVEMCRRVVAHHTHWGTAEAGAGNRQPRS